MASKQGNSTMTQAQAAIKAAQELAFAMRGMIELAMDARHPMDVARFLAEERKAYQLADYIRVWHSRQPGNF